MKDVILVDQQYNKIRFSRFGFINSDLRFLGKLPELRDNLIKHVTIGEW